jgi:hypothetical protein
LLNRLCGNGIHLKIDPGAYFVRVASLTFLGPMFGGFAMVQRIRFRYSFGKSRRVRNAMWR